MEDKINLTTVKKKLLSYFKNHKEVLFAYIFGSQITKKTNKFSDIDIAIFIDKIPIDFAKKIKSMPGLRNILVHEYGIIDIKKIYDILQNNLGDFEDFIFYTKKYLEKE